MDAHTVANVLTRWFATHGRALPWRRHYKPYHVLVAEFVLQQTRMEVGVPRIKRFLARFPTLRALAEADEATVLAEWSGLGYYSRARNLHRTARILSELHAGRVPADPAVLEMLPGVGPYTAGAIASIAYDRAAPSLDGNQVRVLSRLLGTGDSRALLAFSQSILAQGSPRVLNQALMDLGSGICGPRQPNCSACPLRKTCLTKGPGARPAPRPKKSPAENYRALIAVRNGRLWLEAPSGKGILGSVWLPPLRRVQREGASTIRHRFSHREWRIELRNTSAPPSGEGAWKNLDEIGVVPHSRLTLRIAALALGHHAAAKPNRGRPKLPR